MDYPDGAQEQANLRQRAEDAMRGKPVDLAGLQTEDIQYLLHELQVHQAELSIQNDELRRVQQELETSRNRYSDLYNFAPAGYCTIDRKGGILEANQTLAVMLGVEQEQLIRRPLSDFVYSEDQDEYYLHRVGAVKNKQRQVCEIRMVNHTGEKLFVRLVSVISPGDPSRLMIMVNDITEYKQAEQALKESEERLKLSTDAANIGIWDWNLVKDELTWNEHCKAIFGLPVDQDVSFQKYVNAIHPNDRSKIAYLTPETLEPSKLYEREYRVIWPDESLHWVLDIGKVYTNRTGEPVRMAGIAMDITRQRQNEVKMLQDAAELIILNRELQDFASIASHDLQEPLRKVQAFGELLKAKTGTRLNEEEQDFVNRMGSAAKRMQLMIDSLLAYTRISSKPQPYELVDLSKITQEVLSDLETRITRSGGSIEVRDLGSIRADPFQMRQLFQNLISNAFKYARAGIPPQVKIYTKYRTEGPAEAPVVDIFVEDNGIGFDEKLADHLFLPFHRLVGRSEYEGSGMGLAICRKVVERHRGSIAVKSSPGTGSTFIVTLPMRQ